MNYLHIINPIFHVYNLIIENSSKIWKTGLAVYRICTQNPVWYISENGQFVNSSAMNVFDKDTYWIYEDGLLIKSNACNSKKLPFLSFEFKYDDVIVNMDDFVENTRYKSTEVPPLCVIMAAFCIETKTFYPWSSSQFTVYSKMGDQILFSGSSAKFPEGI